MLFIGREDKVVRADVGDRFSSWRRVRITPYSSRGTTTRNILALDVVQSRADLRTVTGVRRTYRGRSFFVRPTLLVMQ